LRPALVTLAARATTLPFDPARARKLGACMEMIHMATLIHDDVIDGAATRRGKATASSVYGNTAAILCGDVLLSKAMSILAQDGDIEIIRMVSDAVVELAEGECAELEVRGRLDLSVDDHFRILRMKTASFIEACCRTGAKAAGASEAEEKALGQFGHHIGMAFQIVDDLLDYQGQLERTGKPRATDFYEGCPTLPLIALVGQLEPAEASWLKGVFGEARTDDVDRIVEWMDQRGAFVAAEKAADEEVSLARLALADLPDSPHRDVLSAVAQFVRARKA
jgi:octaprenyl-diphosphate synthase